MKRTQAARQRECIEALARHSPVINSAITAGRLVDEPWELTMERVVIEQDRLIGLLYADLRRYAEKYGAVPA